MKHKLLHTKMGKNYTTNDKLLLELLLYLSQYYSLTHFYLYCSVYFQCLFRAKSIVAKFPQWKVKQYVSVRH